MHLRRAIVCVWVDRRRHRARWNETEPERCFLRYGLAIVNVLIEGTTYLGMFEPGSYCLFGRDELPDRFKGWKVLYHVHDSFDAPGDTKKEFATIVAQK